MSEVVVGGIPHIRKIYCRDTIVPGSINHLAECGILVLFSAGPDHRVCEPPVKDGAKSVDMDLIEASGGLAVRLKKVSGSLGLGKMSTAEPSQAASFLGSAAISSIAAISNALIASAFFIMCFLNQGNDEHITSFLPYTIIREEALAVLGKYPAGVFCL
ncbi:MAG: hypothetical protein MR430_06940 [Lachnospiraceae bacterium]|nr:hypothetical protein [Lachnospiraceae bacterium]